MERQTPTTHVKHNDAFSKALIASTLKYLGEESIPSLEKKEKLDDFSQKDPKEKASPADPSINLSTGGGPKQSHGAEIKYTNVVKKEEYEVEMDDGSVYVIEKEKGLDGKACWKGYKQMGTKKKGDKTVDNCVKEDTTLSDIVEKAVSNAKEKFMSMIKDKKKGEMKDDSGKDDTDTPPVISKGSVKKKEVKEGMDAVGKEDSDVDNNGKVNKSDKFLKSRRDKVSKIVNAKKKVDEMLLLHQEIISEKKH